LGLDSGTRGYNQRCRDTVALPPPSSLEWAKARVDASSGKRQIYG
jgi:hypothetical protein